MHTVDIMLTSTDIDHLLNRTPAVTTVCSKVRLSSPDDTCRPHFHFRFRWQLSVVTSRRRSYQHCQ